VEKREYPEYIYVAERICGICSYIHSNTYAECIEQIMHIEIPERAQYLRTIWSEYSRLHSHLLWLGLFADGMGFESVFMNAWRLREHILDDMEATTGGRVIQGVCKVGGVRKDIAPEKLDEMLKGLKGMEHELRDLTDVFLNDASVIHRLRGAGVLKTEDAYYLALSGLRPGEAAFRSISGRPAMQPTGRSTLNRWWRPQGTAMPGVRSGQRSSTPPSISSSSASGRSPRARLT